VRKETVILFLLLVWGTSSFGQFSVGNPLITVHYTLQTNPNNIAHLRFLHAEGDYYFSDYNKNNANRKSLDSAFEYYGHALKLSLKLHLDVGPGRYRCLSRLAEIWMIKGDTSRGLSNFRQVARYYRTKGDLFNEAEELYKMYSYIGRYNNALAFNGLYQLIAVYTRLKKNDAAITTGYNCTWLNQQSGNTAESERICLNLIKEFRFKKCTKLNYIYTRLSNLYRYQGNPNKSLQYIFDAIKWAKETQGETAEAKSVDFYGELGMIYQDLGQIENSIYWYKKTIETKEKRKIDQIFLFRTAGFMVQGLIKLHRTKEGLKYLTALVKRRPPVNNNEKAAIAQIKAYCYDDLNQVKSAEQYYLEALPKNGEFTEKEIAFRAKYDIAAFYVRQRKYKEAKQFMDRPLEADNPISVNRDAYLLLFKIDSAQGRMTDAIRHFQSYKILNDSIFNTAKSRQVSELQIKYATEQKENDIHLLKKDQSFQAQQLRQANTIQNLTFIGVALLVIVLTLLFISFRTNQRKSKEIDLKNASLNNLIIEKDNLLQEKEWLIKEVHHRVKNNLQIVMGLLQRQSSFIHNKVALTAIQNSEHRMHSIALIHQKLYQTESFKLVNMADYIVEMIGYLQESFDLGTRIIFEKELDDIDFDISTAVPVGLILNEAITNAIKYAFQDREKGRIHIALNQTGENSYALRIADNGQGLPADFDILQTSSMGFSLIRGLSKQLGGKFTIENKPGVSIVITFNLQH